MSVGGVKNIFQKKKMAKSGYITPKGIQNKHKGRMEKIFAFPMATSFLIFFFFAFRFVCYYFSEYTRKIFPSLHVYVCLIIQLYMRKLELCTKKRAPILTNNEHNYIMPQDKFILVHTFDRLLCAIFSRVSHSGTGTPSPHKMKNMTRKKA